MQPHRMDGGRVVGLSVPRYNRNLRKESKLKAMKHFGQLPRKQISSHALFITTGIFQ